jgi:glycosyltransferase involved in cell wall biosynthesis
MKGKKVCHITTVHPALDIRIFEKECISLVRFGWEVHLLAPNTESRVERGVQIHGVDFSSENRWLRMIGRPRRMLKLALEIDADIYHFHDPEFLFQAVQLVKLGKKVIYDVHEDVPRQILGKPYIPTWIRPFISKSIETLENILARKLSYIITATDTIKARFDKIHPEVRTVFNFPIIEEILEIPPWNARHDSVVYVGGITAIRGIREIVNAMECLPDNVKLHLAGPISPPEFAEEISALSGWNRVVYHGLLDRKEISELLRTSKIGLVTLYPQVNYLDSMPIKLFEYALAGMPVVASDFPFWKQLVSENGWGINVNPTSPDAIAAAINYLLKNQSVAEEMGANGRAKVVEELNWSNQAQILIACYHSLI